MIEEVSTTFKGREKFFMNYNMKIVSVFICNSEMKLPQKESVRHFCRFRIWHSDGSFSYIEYEKVEYSWTLLNGHPSTVDTHNIKDNSGSQTVLPFTLVFKQPLNSKHPATRYNRQFHIQIGCKQYYDPDLVDIHDLLSKIVHYHFLN